MDIGDMHNSSGFFQLDTLIPIFFFWTTAALSVMSMLLGQGKSRWLQAAELEFSLEISSGYLNICTKFLVALIYIHQHEMIIRQLKTALFSGKSYNIILLTVELIEYIVYEGCACFKHYLEKNALNFAWI